MKPTPSAYKFCCFGDPFLDAGIAFLARELSDLFPNMIQIETDGFLFTFPDSNWEEMLFSRIVEQRERRLKQLPAKSNKTEKTLVHRFIPGAGGSSRWGHPVFGKGTPGEKEKGIFISLVRQAFDLEATENEFTNVCGVTGEIFPPHVDLCDGLQSIYPFMVAQKQNLGGVREMGFKHSQRVILAGICSWMASIPFNMFYKEGSPISLLFYPIVSDFKAGIELETKFDKLLQFDHSPFGNFRLPQGANDSPFSMLVRLYERYRLDTSRVLPCEQWFVLMISREGQGYDVRAFECAIPSLADFNRFFDSLHDDPDKEPFGLGTWLSRFWIKLLEEKTQDHHDAAKEHFLEWMDGMAKSFFEDDLDAFIRAFARSEFGHVLYVRGTTRDEFFKIFWQLIGRFTGGKSMEQSFRKGIEAFGKELEKFSYCGRSSGGRKDLSHHYKIARAGSYRALVEAVTDAFAGMMASDDATGTKFNFSQEARQFCQWWTEHLDSEQLNEENWWKVKSVLVAAMNAAQAHPVTAAQQENGTPTPEAGEVAHEEAQEEEVTA
jgi:hypothetical protein